MHMKRAEILKTSARFICIETAVNLLDGGGNKVDKLLLLHEAY